MVFHAQFDEYEKSPGSALLTPQAAGIASFQGPEHVVNARDASGHAIATPWQGFRIQADEEWFDIVTSTSFEEIVCAENAK
jgi:hypothetical protein